MIQNKELINSEKNFMLARLRHAIAEGKKKTTVYLAGVHKEVEDALVAAGIKFEKKKNWGHVLLAPNKGTKAYKALFEGSTVLEDMKAYKAEKAAMVKAAAKATKKSKKAAPAPKVEEKVETPAKATKKSATVKAAAKAEKKSAKKAPAKVEAPAAAPKVEEKKAPAKKTAKKATKKAAAKKVEKAAAPAPAAEEKKD